MSQNNEKLDRLDERLDSVDQRLASIDSTLVKNTVLLDEHIRRTNLLESELRPIKKHVEFINHIAKINSIVGTILLALKQLELF